jgi:hypothetical protein
MDVLFFSRHSLNRILILVGRPTNLETAIQSEHAKLIASGYYRNFRQVMEKRIVAGLTARDIKLGASQKFMLRTLQTSSFKKAIAYSKLTKTTLWFPVSRESQLDLQGLKVDFNPIVCTCLYGIFKVLLSVRSFAKACANQFYLFLSFNKRKKDTASPTSFCSPVFLGGFLPLNFPSQGYESLTFFEWLQNKLGGNHLYLHDCRTLRLFGQSNPPHELRYSPNAISIGSIPTEIQVLNHLMVASFKSIFITRVSIFDFLTQIDDLVKAVRIHLMSPESVVDLALFPNTVVVERPLWSITLERKGKKVVLFHYSASAEPLEIDSERIVDGIWNLSSWTLAWIVDAYQEAQMRAISEFTATEFEVVGVPYWSGRKLDASFFNGGPWVSVFDTTIRSNLVFSASSIDDLGWNNSELEEKFIRLILEAAVPLNLKVLHKKKRRVSETNQLDFDRTAETLKDEFGDFYTVVDENVAPESLIENSSFVVSKPISTIAFSATQYGVPAIILDPTGKLRRDDPGLRNLPVAQQSAELAAFFLSRIDH